MRANVELFVELDAVEADARGALGPDVQAALYDTIDWFRLTRLHVLGDTPLLVARARIGSASAWLFLTGRGEQYGSWYTLRFAPVFSRGVDEAQRTDMIAAIARALRNRLQRVSLQPVDGATIDLLHRGFRQARWLTGQAYQTANWVADTQGGDFATYWAKRPGQLRNTTRRKAVKANLTIRLLDRFDETLWADYETVFAASWKGDEGSPAFLRAIAQRTSDWGRMRMALAYDVTGAPLAAQFWTIDGAEGGEIATIHKLAYVDAAKQLSPGTVLSQAMFAHVIDQDRPREIDFGTGDDPYKADWMDEKRALYRFEAHHPLRPAGLYGYLRARASAIRAALVAARQRA